MSKLEQAIPDGTLPILLMIAAAVAVVIILAAMWPTPMTNDETISETKKCEAAGMMAERVVNGWTFSTVRIDCAPPVHKEQR